jgi:hypothetical protein
VPRIVEDVVYVDVRRVVRPEREVVRYVEIEREVPKIVNVPVVHEVIVEKVVEVPVEVVKTVERDVPYDVVRTVSGPASRPLITTVRKEACCTAWTHLLLRLRRPPHPTTTRVGRSKLSNTCSSRTSSSGSVCPFRARWWWRWSRCWRS